jgi:hypothetical protein
MALDDRIRPTVDEAIQRLELRLEADVYALVEECVARALHDHEEETSRRVLEAEVSSRAREREAEMAAASRLLEGVRMLDGASTLSEVLDRLGEAASREAGRAAVLVVKAERLIGWKISGFGPLDTQARDLELALDTSSIIGEAASTGRPTTTTGNAAGAPAFANLPEHRTGLAVPITVGGRAVAVVYADTAAAAVNDHYAPSAWPETIEMLARHAARCLEALTVQKTATAAAPRFWMQATPRSV